MLLFVAALIGVNLTVSKISAAHNYQTAQLFPACAAALTARALFMTADGDGAYYVIDINPKVAPVLLAKYRSYMVELTADMTRVTALATTDEQRKAIADYHAFMDGSNGYIEGEEQSFTEKAAGQYTHQTLLRGIQSTICGKSLKFVTEQTSHCTRGAK